MWLFWRFFNCYSFTVRIYPIEEVWWTRNWYRLKKGGTWFRVFKSSRQNDWEKGDQQYYCGIRSRINWWHSRIRRSYCFSACVAQHRYWSGKIYIKFTPTDILFSPDIIYDMPAFWTLQEFHVAVLLFRISIPRISSS